MTHSTPVTVGAMTTKVEFKNTLESYRAKAKEFQTITIPEQQFLIINGAGDPSNPDMMGASIEALYKLSYALKFHNKRELGHVYAIPPLEDLWWSGAEFNAANPDKSEFQWKLLSMMPGWLDAKTIATVKQTVQDNHLDTKVCDARLETLRKIHACTSIRARR